MIQSKLAEIEKATKVYAADREELAKLVKNLTDELARATAFLLPGIKRAVARAAMREMELRELIKQSPEAFDKPKTQIFYDIKVGFRKGSGGITWEDEAEVVRLIEKHFAADQQELLIKTTKEPRAKAIAALEVAELKKIGCEVEGTAEIVVIKPIDCAVEKTVKALLKDAAETGN